MVHIYGKNDGTEYKYSTNYGTVGLDVCDGHIKYYPGNENDTTVLSYYNTVTAI